MYSNSPKDWHVEQLKNATAGNWEKMAFIERQKQLPSGVWKRLFKVHQESRGRPPGFARGLRGWILDNVTAIHSVEFSAFHPAGFAGAADGLLDIQGKGPFVVDWKTTGKSIHKSNESQLYNYRHQLGAYSLMLNYRTGIQAQGGFVVVARRSGAPTVEQLDLDGIKKAEDAFLERCATYFMNLPI